ncbi:helix-turn-helix domain-containing protein [Rhabdobacter roseus]|uniref:DNA-binding HxlR family transcriptional regulator n=1 Tax=Rhabdobacter roseus TaxID=1655419 RepID=A0A840TM60_9BACT|nr:helix-turn-helix domain-containing protein [Rhabdobacter roseus]MBB5282323.1 DNA-binding HxlR family transcriptional regulator [Rhabdobacter roseus]
MLDNHACKQHIRAVHDAMDVLNGKWTISIIAVLCYHQQRRFSDILSDVKGISNKMLSKELKEMEMNKLITRTVMDTQPVTVYYELTDYGQKLQAVIKNLSDWGSEHRKKIIEE